MQFRHRLFLLLLSTLVVPFVIVLADFRLIIFVHDRDWPLPIGVAVAGWFVVQTGLASYSAGRWLPNWGWRLLFLGWMLLLSNRYLFWGEPPLHFACISAQISALAAWTILGTSAWWRRLALLSLVVGPDFVFDTGWPFLIREGTWVEPSRIIVLVQIVGTCVLAFMMDVVGYRIEAAGSGASDGGLWPIQFSIRHLLIGTTAVGILVPVVQGLVRASPLSLSERQLLHASLDGVVLAVVSLAGTWVALGAGRCWIRVLVFSLLALGGGVALACLEEAILHNPPYWSPAPIRLTDTGWWWVGWPSMAGSTLAGLLLVLRATGYRLLRRRRWR